MFAAAVWLAWVLAEQAGAARRRCRCSASPRRWRSCCSCAVGPDVAHRRRSSRSRLTGAFTWRPLVGADAGGARLRALERGARERSCAAKGRGVFVNFTAAWCVTCKVNEVAALSRPRVARAFAERNVAYSKADWTNRDDDIAAALAEHGRAGVPLYLYYPPDGRRASGLAAASDRSFNARNHCRRRAMMIHEARACWCGGGALGAALLAGNAVAAIADWRARRRRFRSPTPNGAHAHARGVRGPHGDPRMDQQGCPYVRKHYDAGQHAVAAARLHRPRRGVAAGDLFRAWSSKAMSTATGAVAHARAVNATPTATCSIRLARWAARMARATRRTCTSSTRAGAGVPGRDR